MSLKNRKIYVVGNAIHYANWMQGELVDDINKANLVVFTGGEDWNPNWYNEPTHPKTYMNTERDFSERVKMKQALRLNIPMIGICRGSQGLCVFAGGKLVQHQSNYAYIHSMYTYDDKRFNVNSTHHQAQFPFNLEKDYYKILGWTENICGFHEDGNKKEMKPEKECEVVFYPKINSLGIQCHPESLNPDSDAVKYFQKLLTKFLNKEL